MTTKSKDTYPVIKWWTVKSCGENISDCPFRRFGSLRRVYVCNYPGMRSPGPKCRSQVRRQSLPGGYV